jgi:hypothetical protein
LESSGVKKLSISQAHFFLACGGAGVGRQGFLRTFESKKSLCRRYTFLDLFGIRLNAYSKIIRRRLFFDLLLSWHFVLVM